MSEPKETMAAHGTWRRGSTAQPAGRLVVVTDYRMDRTGTRIVPALHDDAFHRYRGSGRPIAVVVRLSKLGGDLGSSNLDDISLLSVRDFNSLGTLIRGLPSIAGVLRRLPDEDSILLRLPSLVGFVTAGYLQAAGRPYAVEVVGDMGAVAECGAVGVVAARLHPLARGIQRRAVSGAVAVSYVTPAYLQRRYPAAVDAQTSVVPDIRLAPEDFRAPYGSALNRKVPQLIAVGAQDRHYKGHAVLIEALASLIGGGVPCRLVLVGNGRLHDSLRALAKALGVAGSTEFRTQVSRRSEVRALLDSSDVFVMPSLTEGMPRALLEAMARGLPAVGSAVGGIPDMLEPDDCVHPGDSVDLARRLRHYLQDPEARRDRGRRNRAVVDQLECSRLDRTMARWFCEWTRA